MIPTNRSRGLEFVAAASVSIALLIDARATFLLTVPVIGVVLYHRLTGLSPVELDCHRAFSRVTVVPGESVTVSVTVTNTGDTNIPDLRLQDHVPEKLSVVEGTPTHSASLQPGESTTLTYTVRARKGRHTFETVDAIVRNTSGSTRHTQTLSAERTLVSEVLLEDAPVAAQASNLAGRLDSATSGSGIEFHSTREYHPSDAVSDIDWRRFARTGELSVIEYDDPRAAAVHIVVDRRDRTTDDGVATTTIREMSLYAAGHVIRALADEGHKVGLTNIGGDGETRYPSKGRDQYRWMRRSVTDGGGTATATDGGAAPEDGQSTGADGAEAGRSWDSESADELVSQTASHTQFIVVTGLYDESLDGFVSRLAAHDRSVIVISPRTLDPGTAGTRLARVRRSLLVDRLRRRGVRVLDWQTDEPLQLAIERRFGGLDL